MTVRYLVRHDHSDRSFMRASHDAHTLQISAGVAGYASREVAKDARRAVLVVPPNERRFS